LVRARAVLEALAVPGVVEGNCGQGRQSRSNNAYRSNVSPILRAAARVGKEGGDPAQPASA